MPTKKITIRISVPVIFKQVDANCDSCGQKHKVCLRLPNAGREDTDICKSCISKLHAALHTKKKKV